MKKLITEEDVKKIEKQGGNVVVVSSDCILTPLAIDRIRSSRLTVIEKDVNNPSGNSSNVHSSNSDKTKIAIGSDHTGFKMKNCLIKFLSDQDYQVIDVGTYDEKSCDYPDFAKEVARQVSLDEVDYGVLLDATGIPSAITANKINGIRAATCYDAFTAKSSRAHNNANILVLGVKALGEESMKEVINVWLSTKFEGGRHQRRLDKISDIEKSK